jgi:hypothetical protein
LSLARRSLEEGTASYERRWSGGQERCE